MALSAGTRLGPYEILSALGAGGMGEVYRATDTNLKRQVAIKVLPASVAGDADRLARFQREAEVLAALNHPNIAHIHGLERADGTIALVMELVEGPTLADRIAQGPIPLDEALPIAKQIAEALEAAHEQGIIHRDLKPANIKVRSDGTVKVLDFGLAKAMDPAGASSVNAMNSPTLTAATVHGVILGTAAYMSPEQAAGKAVDKRSDLWGFGVVLLEMLTGRPVFTGETVSHVLASVLKEEPDWTTLPAFTPAPIQRLLRRCLEKDRRKRLADAADARLEIEEALTAAPAGAPRRVVPVGTALVLGSALVVAFGILGGLLAWRLKPVRAVSDAMTRFAFVLPEGQGFTRTGRRVVSISPDGKRVAYIANTQIYVREMNDLTARPVAGTLGDPLDLVFSPDSQWIAYFEPSGPDSDGRFALKRIAVAGGSPLTLCEAGFPFGASWYKDTIVFAQNDERVRGVQRVAATGGSPRTWLTVGKNEMIAQPSMLDDEGRTIFTLKPTSATAWDDADVIVQAAVGGTRKVIVHGGTAGRVLPDGHLLYMSRGSLVAAAFDVRQLERRSDAVAVLEGVLQNDTGGGQFAVADNGTLVFVAGLFGEASARAMVWVDRQGHQEEIPATPRQYIHPRLSPDGRRIAVAAEDAERDLWVWDLSRKALTRLTAGPDSELFPVWTPDGRQVIYSSTRSAGSPKLFRMMADGTGTPQPIVADVGGGPTSVTPDGKLLVYRANPKVGVGTDTLMSLDGNATPRPLLPETSFSEINTTFSPDGRWIAYESHGAGIEIFVRPFPGVNSGRWQISTRGGENPVWSPDGREIFYETALQLMRVPVQPGPPFLAGAPEPLFSLNPYMGAGTLGVPYDISKDGQRFLMIKRAAESSTSSSLILVTHWFDELRARMPTK